MLDVGDFLESRLELVLEVRDLFFAEFELLFVGLEFL